MVNFSLCENFNITNLIFNRKSKRKTFKRLKEDIELLQNLNVTRNLIINHILQKTKQLLECEYYILHLIDMHQRYDSICGVDDLDIDTDHQENCNNEDIDYIQLHKNYVSKNFIKFCDKDFIKTYFRTKMSCNANLTSVDNIFGHVIETKQYFATNDIYNEELASCRFPKGHPKIKNFLCIPFLTQNSSVYAILGFANTTHKFNKNSYRTIKPILNILNDILPELIK